MSFRTLASALGDKEDYTKYFLGTVVDIVDPESCHRVKATVPGLYEDPELAPWIGPAAKSAFGIGQNFGTYGSPQLGSVLIVELQGGDPHYPIYHGCVHLPGNKTDEVKEAYHEEAWGFMDPSGNSLLVDMRARVVIFRDSHGVTFDLREGTLSVTVPDDLNVTVGAKGTIAVTGDVALTVGGKVDATVTGDLNANVGGKATLAVTGDLAATVGGGMTASIGGSTTIESAGDMSFTGPSINLNGG